MSQILVVDDNQALCLLLADVLEEDGHSVTTAFDGEAASKLIATTPFEVVVSDIAMPYMSGIDLLSVIEKSSPDTMVIMMTGDPSITTATGALQGGACDYLPKPVNHATLLRAVNRAVRKFELKAEKKKIIRDNQAHREQLEFLFEERTKSLRSSEIRLQSMLTTTPVGIVVIRHGMLCEANPAFCTMMGYSKDEVIGRAIDILYDSVASGTNVNEQINRAIADVGVARLCTIMRRKDGELRNVELQASPMNDERVKDVSITLIIQDITDHRLLQVECDHAEIALNDAQKMDALGRLAAGIAHEITIPAQEITNNIIFIKESLADIRQLLEADKLVRTAAINRGEPLAKAAEDLAKKIDIEYLLKEIPTTVEQSLDGMSRIKSILAAMKEYSDPVTADFIPTDINHIIENTLMVCRSEWKFVAVVIRQLNTKLPTVRCNASEISQVILHLVVNACDAISETLKPGTDQLGTIEIATDYSDGWCEIRITDSGSGIPEAIQKRIFEPFFTTKGIGKGTGQGLALARTIIVEKHHGELMVESKPGSGATFIIRMPINPEKPS